MQVTGVPEGKRRDERFKLNLPPKQGGTLHLWKDQLERIHGRKLEWSEFVDLLATYVDLPAGPTIEIEVRACITNLHDLLLKNKEAGAAQTVHLFGDALVRALKGNMNLTTLNSAIIDAAEEHAGR